MNLQPWFIDAGHWIALLNRGDQLHERARRLNATLRGRLVTTEAVLTEVGNWMARPPLRALVAPFLHRVHSNPHLEIVAVDHELFARAVTFFTSRADKDWGLTDCISFVVMQDRGITEALSADVHFVQAGFRALLRE
ncbi:MAG: type II toxin-antitoxin system VapC family toxin [Dehalococcoidia bacterium]